MDETSWLEAKLKETGSTEDAVELLLATRRAEMFKPSGLKPSASPLTIVSGPPGSGKTTWVKTRAGKNDLVIDLDDIKSRLSGKPTHQAGDEWSAPALAERNMVLKELSTKEYNRVWFVVGAPKAEDRQWWSDKLGAEATIVINPANIEEQIDSDPEREGRKEDHKEWAARWQDNYTPSDADTIITAPETEQGGGGVQ